MCRMALQNTVRDIYFIPLVILALIISGCASTHIHGKNKYGCVNFAGCGLPELPGEGESLIYVIRPYRLFNQGEKHDLFVVQQGKADEVAYARIFGSTYCAIHTKSRQITIRVAGYLNDSEISLDLVPGETYYVELDTTLTVFSSKLTVNLKRISMEVGEKYLMEDVTSSCARI